MRRSIRLIIADDHPVVREGIVGMLTGHPDFTIIAQADDGEEVVALAQRHAYDVILMDLQMPHLDGFGAIERIMRQQPQARIIVLTSYDKEQDIRRALKLGAVGYLLKDSPRETIYSAILRAMEDKRTLSPEVAERLVESLTQPQDMLTEREITVLTLASKGNTNKGIGKQLHISEATVKTHLKHIYVKLDVPDRASAVAVALKRGLIGRDEDG